MSIVDRFNSWDSNKKRDWLIANIPENDWTNRSGSSVLTELRDSGLKMANELFYSTRRDVLGIVSNQENLQRLGDTSLIPESWVTDVNFEGMTSKYHYQFKATGTAIEANQQETRYFSIATDERLTVGEIKSKVEDLLTERLNEYDFQYSDINLFRVYGKR